MKKMLLTKREQEIFELLVLNKSTKEIAEKLNDFHFLACFCILLDRQHLIIHIQLRIRGFGRCRYGNSAKKECGDETPEQSHHNLT